MGSKFTLKNLRRVKKNPSVLLGELGMLALTANQHLSRTTGEPVMDQDWDVLLLLDGCRFDMFEESSRLEGNLTRFISLGSHSTEFIRRNFAEEQYHDTVYVSANPHVESIKGKKIFHDIVDVFDWGWDKEYQTVLPETVADATIETAKKYPNKRIISHFIQPHTPFIGDTGSKITHAGLTGEGGDRDTGVASDELSLWMRLRYRLATEPLDQIWEAFVENLELAIPHVERIWESVSGKVVVSADHGNMMGERMYPIPAKMWGHPPKIDHPVLTEVPWLEMPYEERRTTTSDQPVAETRQMNESEVENRLHALGYT